MPLVSYREVLELHSDPGFMRNVCLLAHVDHGKTTLADNLIAYNNIISKKLSGSLRYMDSREDEQRRGITMKSSGISIVYDRPSEGPDESNEIKPKRHLIHLIDSPGHLDFIGEFSAAARLSDGALILVDVVEGVCTQTVKALREAWTENITPILVINKVDRLILELQLSPLDAYRHLNKVLEQANATAATFQNEHASIRDLSLDGHLSDQIHSKSFTFNPKSGNVIFSSSIDQWAFKISDFSKMYSKKHGFSENSLTKALWGEYYIDMKKGTIKQIKSAGEGRNPAFVSLILENIWAVYRSVMDNNNEKLGNIIRVLNLKVLPSELKSKDKKRLCRTLMGQWLPLAEVVLSSLVDLVPPPNKISDSRINRTFFFNDDNKEAIIESIKKCDKNNPKTAMYCSKTFLATSDMITPISESLTNDMEKLRISQIARKSQTMSSEKQSDLRSDSSKSESEIQNNQDNFTTVGVARVFFGRIFRGQILTVYGPEYDHNTPSQNCYTFDVQSIYILMGRELVEVPEASSGSIVGIRLGDKHDFKTSVISDTNSMSSNYSAIIPMVKVAVEPINPSEMPILIDGLKKLSQSDSAVVTNISNTGESIISACGELHLERCLHDLRNSFAKINIRVSSPMIPFRETILDFKSPYSSSPNELYEFYLQKHLKAISSSLVTSTKISTKEEKNLSNVVTLLAPAKLFSVTIQALRIPESMYQVMQNFEILRTIKRKRIADYENFINVLTGKAQEEDNTSNKSGFWEGLVGKIRKFGPDESVENVLINNISFNEDENSPCGTPSTANVSSRLSQTSPCESQSAINNNKIQNFSKDIVEKFMEFVDSGFNLATRKGPLCDEPMAGVAFILRDIQLSNEVTIDTVQCISSQAVNTTRDACIGAFLSWSCRLSLAMYDCTLLDQESNLGKIYTVIRKRRGYIESEEMNEGTLTFFIKSKIPIANSFGFAQEMRKQTSGVADPQLSFCGFEILDEDPFWIPSTEDELENFGEKADKENIARKYIDTVRKQKGLPVYKKEVISAEKQKTMKNK